MGKNIKKIVIISNSVNNFKTLLSKRPANHLTTLVNDEMREHYSDQVNEADKLARSVAGQLTSPQMEWNKDYKRVSSTKGKALANVYQKTSSKLCYEVPLMNLCFRGHVSQAYDISDSQNHIGIRHTIRERSDQFLNKQGLLIISGIIANMLCSELCQSDQLGKCEDTLRNFNSRLSKKPSPTRINNEL